MKEFYGFDEGGRRGLRIRRLKLTGARPSFNKCASWLIRLYNYRYEHYTLGD